MVLLLNKSFRGRFVKPHANDRFREAILARQMTGVGRLPTDSHLQCCHSTRPGWNRRHPASRDPKATAANASFEAVRLGYYNIAIGGVLSGSSRSLRKIAGCVALISGSNRGLGRAFCEGLLEAGASKIYAAARDPSTVRARDSRVVPIKLDVTSVSEAIREFYRI